MVYKLNLCFYYQHNVNKTKKYLLSLIHNLLVRLARMPLVSWKEIAHIIFAAFSIHPVNAKYNMSYVAIKTDHNYMSVLVVVAGVQHFACINLQRSVNFIVSVIKLEHPNELLAIFMCILNNIRCDSYQYCICYKIMCVRLLIKQSSSSSVEHFGASKKMTQRHNMGHSIGNLFWGNSYMCINIKFKFPFIF